MKTNEVIEYVGIRWSNGAFKWPSLSELYLKMTGEEFDPNKAHDALADTEATMTSYFKLKEKGIIPLTSEEK
jgi:DNA polymerase-3 subunit alpha